MRLVSVKRLSKKELGRRTNARHPVRGPSVCGKRLEPYARNGPGLSNELANPSLTVARQLPTRDFIVVGNSKKNGLFLTEGSLAGDLSRVECLWRI
jgi:hypothetical protein